MTENEKVFDPTTEDETNVAAETTAESAAAEGGTLEQQLADAKAEAARNLEGWQRTQAEFANARKRFEKQRADLYASANSDLAAKILPILDDFERALASAPDPIRGDAWFSGVELVHRKFMSILEGMGVESIESVGQPFDPNLHEALGQEPSTDYDSGVVTRQMQRGYRLGDKVIRPSLVYVAE